MTSKAKKRDDLSGDLSFERMAPVFFLVAFIALGWAVQAVLPSQVAMSLQTYLAPVSH